MAASIIGREFGVNHLTQNQRETLNAAHDILMSIMTEPGHYWTYGFRWTKGCEKSWDLAMFTPALNTQHSWVEGETLADKIETGLALIAEENGQIPTEEERKARRLETLRAEIARLEKEA